MIRYRVVALVLIVLLIYFFRLIFASGGDRSQFYQNCLKFCTLDNCTQSGVSYKKELQWKHDPINKLLMWTCYDECGYDCMWRTTSAFHNRNWTTPQFYGKWPFVRFLGMQEPASVLFSIANFITHYKMLQRFKREVRTDSPMYGTWRAFSYICLNAWIWSAIFHTRDFPVTELLDYTFAYSMVLASFHCMVMRMIHRTSVFVRGTFSFLCVLFFINHFSYLSIGRFDYTYNMKANIVTGMSGALGWILWCFLQRRKRRYVWKCFIFIVLATSSLLLEINDFPPILWTFDAHSIWHLVTAPLTILFYSFIIEDCKTLRKELASGEDEEESRKLL
ncbi:post-GPI attachment to proteins factor 3 [Anopheles stephensi]|uniref:post-GPI attachment to proteins factor 3 n=1 Tax=Anopheles stephensi TaxID=30069 RepID=UPI001658AB5D|nr:post-GPI attachment to proteins factor 3 [Anopheles stephensi]